MPAAGEHHLEAGLGDRLGVSGPIVPFPEGTIFPDLDQRFPGNLSHP